MMRMRISDHRRYVILALAFCVSFLFTSSAIADPLGAVDVPAAAAGPHSIQEQIKLTNDYLDGRGVTQDFAQSAYWFQKAAEAGDAESQMQIGYLYDAGIGVSKDPERAAHWYQLAASNGWPRAKVNLAILYFWGNGVKKNQPLAAQ